MRIHDASLFSNSLFLLSSGNVNHLQISFDAYYDSLVFLVGYCAASFEGSN